MKIRNGFVSNSSSSSFIVGFTHRPNSAEEMRDMMFPNGEKTFANPHQYDDNDVLGWSTIFVARRVLEDMGKPLSIDMLAKELDCSMLAPVIVGDEHPIHPYENPGLQYYDLPAEQQRPLDDAYNKACKNWARRQGRAFMKKHPGRTFYCFEYSDNDSSFDSALEYGDIFRNLPHVHISHH